MTRITSVNNVYRLPSAPAPKGASAVKFQANGEALAQKQLSVSSPVMLDALKAKSLNPVRFGGLITLDSGEVLSMSGPNAKEVYLKSLQQSDAPPSNVSVVEETENGPMVMDLESKLFNQGAIVIEGTVNPYMASKVTKQIQYLVSKRVQNDDKTPIFLLVNSGGGSIYDGNAILDYMDLAKNTKLPSGENIKVVAMIAGIAGSMASVIAVNADKCYMTPRSRFMLHEAAYGVQGKTSEHREHIEDTEEIERGLMEVYSRKTGYPVDEFKAWLKKIDRWLNPDKSMWLGIADGVLRSFDDLKKIYAEEGEALPDTKPQRPRAATLKEIDDRT